MKRLNIAVLLGGISSEREVSLSGGEQVIEALDKNKYHVNRYDPKTDIGRLVADAPKIDAALIILHGPYGEDGTIQGLLDLLDIPYQGSGVLGSALAMDKLAAKRMYEQAGLLVPAYIPVYRNDSILPDLYIERIGLPFVVKPVKGGSSIGATIVKSADMIEGAIQTAFRYDDTLLIEAYIDGVELTGGVIGNDELTALPIIEIIPDKSHEFFDYVAKYTAGVAQEICPARIDDEITEKAQSFAKIAHQSLFCRGYSRTDMILKDRDLYVLETNTIPGMTPNSLLPLAARTAGLPFSDLLDRLIELGMEGR